MSSNLKKIEKCQGAMLASAIGDALGWPNEIRAKNINRKQATQGEFVEWTRRCGGVNWHYESILPGEYSDDTQMILCIARSIIVGDWERNFCKNELPYWLQYERGGGRSLLKAARACEKGTVLWKTTDRKAYFASGGNGAVMRILPHVIAHSKYNDSERLMEDIIRDAIITHGHPRAILGATCYAFALNYLLRKDSMLEFGELAEAVIQGENVWGKLPDSRPLQEWKKEALETAEYDYLKEWNQVRGQIIEQLRVLQDVLRKGLLIEDREVLGKLGAFSKESGAGDIAVLAAIYFFSKYANNPVLGVKSPALMYGVDTDTIASVTGGLLGMFAGKRWIPIEWKGLQDYKGIELITELLLSDDMKEETKKVVDAVKKKCSDWESTPIGKMRLIEEKKMQGRTEVIVSKWESVLGQTIYFKKYAKSSSKKELQKETDDKQWVLSSSGIKELLDCSELQRISLRKALKIIECLLMGDDVKETAKKVKVDISTVKRLNSYVVK